MAKVRKRRLRGGAHRWDVVYTDHVRRRCLVFTDGDEAADYAHLVDLRTRRLWPLAPLLERAGLEVRQLTYALGVNRTTVGRYEHYGLTDIQADHWATRLGYHPIQVWGWDWITATTRPTDPETDEVAESEDAA